MLLKNQKNTRAAAGSQEQAVAALRIALTDAWAEGIDLTQFRSGDAVARLAMGTRA
jgi:hypothetical protein